MASILAKLEAECPDKTELLADLATCISKGWRDAILPDALLGYHILSSSGLTATERATVLTATTTFHNQTIEPEGETPQNNGLSLAVVEKALLSTWQDRELIERDSGLASQPKGFKRKNFKGRINAVNDDSSGISDSEAEANEIDNVNTDDSEKEDGDILDALEDPLEQEAFAVALTRKYNFKDKFKKARISYKESRKFH